jgi:hypothetical protein
LLGNSEPVEKQSIATTLKPEDEELARKQLELAGLQSELAERELFLATLQYELSAFERLYLKIVGSRYAELDEIEAQVAERIAREQTNNKEAQESAKQARARATESRSTVEADNTKNLPKGLPSQDLKNLYREAAKRMHPDLSSDSEDRKMRHRFMSEANQAYQMGDLNRLRQILEEYESSPDAVKGDGVGVELVRVIRKITQVTKRLKEIEIKIEALSASDIAKLKTKAEEYEKQGRDLLAEMAEQLKRQIAEARKRASEMTV